MLGIAKVWDDCGHDILMSTTAARSSRASSTGAGAAKEVAARRAATMVEVNFILMDLVEY